MPLIAGSRLGPYEIVNALGAGGMGEVYKARDTRLDRSVAIKVLPSILADDPEFRERFEREARTISQLAHPHICVLHDVGEHGGRHFLVLEHLDGETLAARLARSRERSLPVDEALAIAIQIADALAAAHAAGIVHRDLKPGNVMLTATGAKLLDFGLAKPTPAVAGGLQPGPNITAVPTTPSAPITVQGAILGTFQYMAPEQIEGHDADPRTDIFAFGCLLYEMFSGRKAFEGKTQTMLIAAILERAPAPIATVQPQIPPALAHVVDQCLQKNPAKRWSSAHDLALQLRWIAPGSEVGPTTASTPAAARRVHPALVAGLVGLVALCAGAVAAWWSKPAPRVDRHVVRFTLALPLGSALTNTNRHLLALSPDGSRIIYVANQQLFLRALDQNEPAPIRGTELNPSNPFFSPDGQWIGYYANSQLKKVPVSGGAPFAICDASAVPYGISWSGDSIYFDQGAKGIFKVAASGGTPELVVAPDDKHAEVFQTGEVLAGTTLLFASHLSSASWDEAEIVAMPLSTKARKTIARGGADPHYVNSGHIVYARQSVLFAMPFDVATLTARGAAVPVVDQMAMLVTPAFQFAVAASGSIVYLPASGIAKRSLAWVDRRGREEAVAAPSRTYYYPRLSPDGTRLAVDVHDQDQDIWIWDFARATLTRLTFGASTEFYPVWTKDGRRVIYSSNANAPFLDLYWTAADGTGEPEKLTTATEGNQFPNAMTPDGGTLLFYAQMGKTSNDIFMLSLGGGRTVRPLVQTPASEMSADVSPDAHWLAYQSNEAGTNDVFVRPYPSAGQGRWQVSNDGGMSPQWSRDGRELFYVSRDGHMMAVPVTASSTFSPGPATALFDMRPYMGQAGRMYDVTRDGQRFLVVKSGAGGETRLQVVENWTEELKARVR